MLKSSATSFADRCQLSSFKSCCSLRSSLSSCVSPGVGHRRSRQTKPKFQNTCTSRINTTRCSSSSDDTANATSNEAPIPDAASVPVCEPGKTTLGFVGMGIMGVPMALNLVNAGYKLVVWNRDSEKCTPLVEAGAAVAASPADVARQCDVVFGMLADPFAAFSVACRDQGIMEGIGPGKGYVDVSTVDPMTTLRIADAIKASGGRFLEAPVSGSKGPAEQGQLVFLGAGDEELFESVQHPLEVMGKASFYLGDVGAGAKMKLVVNMMMGTMMTAFSEALVMTKKAGLSQKDMLEIVSLGAMSCPMYSLKGPSMVEDSFPPAFPLKHQAKDLRIAVDLAREMDIEVPLANSAYLAYRQGLDLGLHDEDFSAVLRAVELDESKFVLEGPWSFQEEVEVEVEDDDDGEKPNDAEPEPSTPADGRE